MTHVPPPEDPPPAVHADLRDQSRAYIANHDMTVDNRTQRWRIKNIVRQGGAWPIVLLTVVAVAAIAAVTWLVAGAIGGGDNEDKGAPAAVSVNTEITLDPTSGPVGTPVRITGIGFEPGKIVQVICQDPINPQLGQFRADESGRFTGDVVIPDDNWIRNVGIVQMAIVAASGQAQESERQGLAFFTVRR